MTSKELTEPPVPYQAEEPVTPYQRAMAEWDDRIGSARVQAKNWRITALLLAGICLVLTSGIVYQSAKSTVVPYVVQVNHEGLVQAVGPAQRTNYVPGKAVVQYFLAQFVTHVRSVPLDPAVAKNQWHTAYSYLRQSAANTMNEIARKEQPLSKLGEETVSVQVKSVVALSQETFQVRWEESTFNKEGVPTEARNMTGVFTLEIEPPNNEKLLQVNPLGLYIKHFSWSQEVSR